MTTEVVGVEDPSAVGAARRAAAALGKAAGLDEDGAGRLALVVTELGTNLVKHARGGTILLRALSPLEGAGVEVLALDRGPGIANVTRSLRDGYSTGGTSGNGLGAVRRAANAFEILSHAEHGTAVVVRVRERSTPPPKVCLGAVALPQAGESVCGDAWGVVVTGHSIRIIVVDGIGHGPLAAAAANAALRAFYDDPTVGPERVLTKAHAALGATRGAVMAVAVLERHARTVTFSGVGNIAATFVSASGRRGLVSQNGVVGYQLPQVQATTVAWPRDHFLVMTSDGIASRWSLDAYPGVFAKHPSIAAGVLLRDFCRGRDDATVVVLRDVDEPRD